jgi:hypothetical protein
LKAGNRTTVSNLFFENMIFMTAMGSCIKVVK